MKYQFAGGLLCLVLGLGLGGCTANVEDPKANVDQSGNQNHDDCTKQCDDAKVTCTGKCTDDSCKGSCTTTYDECTKKCE